MLSRAAYCLMVERVYRYFFGFTYLLKKRTLFNVHKMGKRVARCVLRMFQKPFAVGCGVDVLKHAASEGERERLYSPADAEYRNLSVESEPRQQQFVVVAFGIYSVKSLNGGFVHEKRIDVCASREHKCVNASENIENGLFAAAWRNNHRHSSCKFNAFVVGKSQFACFRIKVAGYADYWSGRGVGKRGVYVGVYLVDVECLFDISAFVHFLSSNL